MHTIRTTCINPKETFFFFENLNRQAEIIIQIESVDGINNLDAILTECGHAIESVWIGSIDLRANIGLEGITADEPEYVALYDKYMGTLKKHNMPASGLCLGTPKDEKKIAKGRASLSLDVIYKLSMARCAIWFLQNRTFQVQKSAYEKDGQ